MDIVKILYLHLQNTERLGVYNMVMRDILIENIQQYEDDNGGGRRKVGDPVQREIICNASLNTNPEVAGQYGLNGQQVLIVFSWEQLKKDAKYIFRDKNYSLRFSNPHRRFVHSILVEEKR